MFTPLSIANIQNAAGFVPTLKMLLSRLDPDVQANMTKYLLSLQHDTSKTQASNDYVGLLTQYESLKEELAASREIIGQLKEQRLEKIDERNKLIQKIAELEGKLQRLETTLQ